MAPTGEGVLLRAFLVLTGFCLILLDESPSKPSNNPRKLKVSGKNEKKKRTTLPGKKMLGSCSPPKQKLENKKMDKKHPAFRPPPGSWNLFLPTKSDSKAASLRHSLGHQPAGVGFRHRQTLKKGRFKKVG